MPNWNKISEEELTTIKNYLRGGLGVREIAEITGRSKVTIGKIKRYMIDEIQATNNVVEIPAEEVEKTQEPMDTVRDHRDDPRWGTNISIEMVAKIVGNKTGYGYRADFGKKLLTITSDEGVQFTLEFDVVEKFLDEMIDVSVEVGDLKKKFA